MLPHVIFVTLKIYEKIESEGGKEIPGDRTMGADCIELRLQAACQNI